jgi:7-cyano-7-deazaguanine reductase
MSPERGRGRGWSRPITSQPDLYTATIEYRPRALCLESKSLKLYLARYRNEGAFCEALAVRIRDDVPAVLELEPQDVRITLRQKARGGITIAATARARRPTGRQWRDKS